MEPRIIFMDDGLPRFVCPQCGVKYKKMSGVKGHLKECGRGAQCPFCPKIVTQRRNLPKHMEKHKRDGLWDGGKLKNDDFYASFYPESEKNNHYFNSEYKSLSLTSLDSKAAKLFKYDSY